MKLTQTGAGSVDSLALRDTDGTGVLPLQAAVTGSATFNVNGRVSPDAPWVALKTGETAAFLEGLSWVPYLQLEVTAGAGTVTLWAGDK